MLPRDLERIASVAEPCFLPCLGTSEKRKANFQVWDEKELKTTKVRLSHPVLLITTAEVWKFKARKIRIHTSDTH